MKHLLPLYNFFKSIQKNSDFSLGIEEYKALIEVLEKDITDKYFSNPEEMLKLCKLLWLKPNQNPKLFERLFKNSFNYLNDEIKGANSEKNQNPIDDNLNQRNKYNEINPDKKKNTKDDNRVEKKEEIKPPKLESSIKKEENQPLYLNFQTGGGLKMGANTEFKQDFVFIRNYVPYKQRRLQQIWRFLRKEQKSAKPTAQIDINETVNNCAKNGYILQPILKKSEKNQTSLITFIDHKGSMLAYKHLANLFANTAITGANITNEIYYFKNVPQRYNSEIKEEQLLYVYIDIGQIKHISLDEIFLNKKDPSVLIISDAGSGKQNINFERINATEEFLKEIYSNTLKVAWLNPIPLDRWVNTSANIICEMVNMYEANTENFKKAMNVLRGRLQPRTTILFPEILDQL